MTEGQPRLMDLHALDAQLDRITVQLPQIENLVCAMGYMGDGSFIQWKFSSLEQGTSVPWSGRKWYISRHATPGEVLQTALRALLDLMEHEIREGFKVDGHAIYGPHISVDAHLGAAKQPTEVRAAAPANAGTAHPALAAPEPAAR